jgi:ribosome-binding protein aMBF1 (putative translation factor)
MTTLFAQAVHEAEKLSDVAQNELAQQILEDITSELRWQQALSKPDSRLSVLEAMAGAALEESKEGKTFIMGFDKL